MARRPLTLSLRDLRHVYYAERALASQEIAVRALGDPANATRGMPSIAAVQVVLDVETGQVIAAVNDGTLVPRTIGTLGEVLTGRIPARRDTEETVCHSSVGRRRSGRCRAGGDSHRGHRAGPRPGAGVVTP